MKRDELRALQAPLKERYRSHPHAALVTLSAAGTLGEGLSCSVESGRAVAQAGLHPATGGDGSLLCSGDMLLEALVACAGVTLQAVATSLGVPVASGRVRAEGDLDFRGTLGVDRAAPVGFSAIRLSFELDTDADQEQLAMLRELTERNCVVYQTLASAPALSHRRDRIVKDTLRSDACIVVLVLSRHVERPVTGARLRPRSGRLCWAAWRAVLVQAGHGLPAVDA